MKPQDPPAAEERPGQTQTRKTYETPELQVYGDLAEITRGAAGSNSSDGQGHPNKHFTS